MRTVNERVLIFACHSLKQQHQEKFWGQMGGLVKRSHSERDTERGKEEGVSRIHCVHGGEEGQEACKWIDVNGLRDEGLVGTLQPPHL